MLLTLTDKLEIFIRVAHSWGGLIFGLGGLLLMATFLPNTDFRSYRFQQTELLLTDGYVISTDETNCLDNDTPISAIYYRYSVGSQSLLGSSFSSSLTVKPRDKVQVEYVVKSPFYSRIRGTINAPYPLWVLLLLSSSVVIGISLVRKGITRTKKIVDIVSNAFILMGNQKDMRSYENDDSTVYEWQYSYQYNGHTYTHIFESNSKKSFGANEKILIQRDEPNNAILANILPRSVRGKLGITSGQEPCV